MNERITYCLTLIPVLPLLAAVVVAVLGPKLLGGHSHIPVILGLAGACVCSLLLIAEVNREQASLPADHRQAGFEQVVTLWTWANVPAAYDLPASGENLPTHASQDGGWG